ncbi:hybrid sensor histidine kinase/response regulator transcription factor [Flagellimonas sp. CMM7]|uniref:hybrid sensor histidine kinase/response regulator transcription factor n=1 Tax=Flagellimonas sp. CMM7 TaxID=2654676 RepID=UPI0013D14D9A|nr:hybrid sensor histidine kinase/response regulator transcription factor [Flagellimonas sp. CMM7]UII78731.1 response regulator [Flagellimonas sp. CMM7]
MRFKKKLHIIVLFLVWGHLCSQEFENISIGEGLSSHQAYSVVEDVYGFIWVTTKSGIDRYNGENVSSYQLPQHKEAPSRVKLIVDDDKTLWAYTQYGRIFRFNYGQNNFDLVISISDVLKEQYSVSNLVVRDSLWISTNKGLFSFEISTERLNQIGEFKEKDIQLTYHLKNDDILLALKDKLVVYNKNKGIRKTISRRIKSLDNSQVKSIFFDQETNEVWIGTRGGEVQIYNLKNERVTKLLEKVPQLPFVPVNKILMDGSHIIIGSDGGGVFKLDKRDKNLIENFKEDEDAPKSLRGNGVQDMILTASGHLIVTTFTGGLNILNNRDKQFNILRHEINNPNSLRNNVVNSILEDVEGDLWFATNNGVSYWQKSNNKWTHFLDGQNEKSNVFLSLFQYDANRIMAGSYSKGIFIIDRDKGIVSNIIPGLYNPNNKDRTDYVVEIFRDNENKIWTGGPFKDLAIYNPKDEHYDYLPITRVTNIQAKDKNHIFIATQSGLYVVDIVNLNYYKEDFGGKLNQSLFINSLHFDSKNSKLWIATSGAGIVKWDIGTDEITRIDKKVGMPSNHVYAILQHQEESIWASTENGLIKYDLQNGKLEIFSLKNGLSDESFYKNSKLRDSSGNFYFGSYEGVTFFNPEDVSLQNFEVKLYLDEFLIDNSVISIGQKNSPLSASLNRTDNLTLKYDENSFSFRFFSIIPLGAGEIRYAWKLEGQDKEWNSPSSNKTANYTNLEKGNYVFKLRAYANENNVVLDERSINIEVRPSPWHTIWAKGIYALIVISIVITIVNFSLIRNKKKLSEEKIRFFMNTAHDIRTPLTLAMAPLSDLEKSSNLDEMDKYYLKLSSSNLNVLSKTIDHLLDFQKSDLGKTNLILAEVNIVDFIKEKIALFESIANHKNIRTEFICKIEELCEYVDLNKFNKILDNLLSNSFKYTPSNGQVTVRLVSSGKMWKIEVSDTGIGISKDSQKDLFKRYYRGNNAVNSKITGTGIGLLLTRNYVNLHKGKIDFESKEGSGTKFTLSFNHGAKHFGKDVIFSDSQEVDYNNKIDQVDKKIASKNVSDEKKKLKLLIAEDNQSLREYLKNSLSGYYRVKTVENGKMALNLIDRFTPHIIISDVGMPVMNGLELTHNIKTKYETSHIPVILLTAYKEKDEIIKGLESGADEYITKPFDTTLLLAKIDSILENRRLVRNRFKRLNSNKLKKDTYANKTDQKFVQRAMDFVEKNITNPNLSKQYFAKEMMVSQTLLYQKLKVLTDQSPVEFIRTIRLRHAAKLLIEGNYNVNEIATLSGFSDSKYFSTCFKKLYGESPSNYASTNSGKGFTKEKF